MAIPSDIAGLRVWYKADAEAYADGDPVGQATDQSGLGYHATQGSASLKPIFRDNRVNGLPSYDFDGADDALANATVMNTIMGAGAHTYFVVFKAHTIDFAFDGLKRGEVIFGMKSHDHISVGLDSGIAKVAGQFYTSNAGDPNPEFAPLAVTLNDWHFATMVWDASADLYFYLDGAVSGSVTGAVTTGRTVNYALRLGYNDDPVAYFDGEIAEVFAFNTALSSTDRKAMEDYIRAKYLPATPSQTEQVRDVLSRKLWIRRKPSGILTVTAPLWMLDADILDRVYMQTEHAPSEDGLGWRAKKWQRRALSVQRISLTANGEAVRLQLLDRRPVDCLLWDTGWSRKGGDGTKADSVARIGVGGARTFTRSTQAWCVNAADDKQVVAARATEPALDYDGELFEAAATNGLLRSSGISGTTGLTVSGSGTVVADTADLLFHSDVSPSSLKFTAGSPHSTALVCQYPTTASYTASTVVRVAVDHYDDGGAALAVRIQRAVDSWYWNDGSGAWQSGAIDNSMAVVSTKSPASRWISKAINVGGTGTTVTVSVVMPSGGTASRINHVYHVEVDNRGQIGSRIVTDTAAFARAKTRLLIENNSGKRCWIAAVGTAGAEVVPLWDAADIGNTNRTIYYVGHDASNWEWLYFDGTNDRWVFERRVAATTYRAVKSATPTRGTAYKVVGRWTGTEGELDLTTFTASIFVDGVKGTDAGTTAAPTEAATVNLEVGSKADAEDWDGHIRRRFVRPYALTDAEIARFEA